MMIDILKPPTDNLYKFAAVFGLVVFVVGCVVPPWLFYQSSLEYLKSAAGRDELDAHAEFAKERNQLFEERKKKLRDELGQLQKQLENLTSSGSSSTAEIDKLKTEITDVEKKAETLEDAANEINLNLKLKEAEAMEQLTLAVNETRNARLIIYAGWIVALCGLIISGLGFKFWYRRVQVFHDTILTIEAGEKIIGFSTKVTAGTAHSEPAQPKTAQADEVQKVVQPESQAEDPE